MPSRRSRGKERLAGYPFFQAAIGELTLRLGRPEDARPHFEAAVRLARSPIERRFFEQRARASGAAPR